MNLDGSGKNIISSLTPAVHIWVGVHMGGDRDRRCDTITSAVVLDAVRSPG